MERGSENDRSYNVCRSCPGHLTLPPAVEFSAFESNGTLCDPYVAFNAIDVKETSAKVIPRALFC